MSWRRDLGQWSATVDGCPQITQDGLRWSTPVRKRSRWGVLYPRCAELGRCRGLWVGHGVGLGQPGAAQSRRWFGMGLGAPATVVGITGASAFLHLGCDWARSL
jgi:hypothetical protein